MTFDEYLHSHVHFPANKTRWVAGLIGSALTAIGLAALVFEAAMLLIAGLGLAMALWLAWIIFDHAVAALDAGPPEDSPGTASGAASTPAFADTQASWWTP